MTKLSIIIDQQGDLRHLNKEVLNNMELGEVVSIQRSSHVEIFDDLPYVAHTKICKTYGSRDKYDHLRRFPKHRLKWWVWIPRLNIVSGPYATRTQALDHEVVLLQDRGLPVHGSA